MKKILCGYLCAIAVSLANAASPAPNLVERAKGYANKGLPEVSTIHTEDGVDQSEALSIAEWQILGQIGLNRLAVQSYDLPKKEGVFWRIDVRVDTQEGLKNRPIFVDSDTGESHGDGWDNITGTEVDLGSSSYQIWRRLDGLHVLVTLKRRTVPGDLIAKEESHRAALRAVEKSMQGFPGRFNNVSDAAIVLSESRWSDVPPDRPDRQWTASFSLNEKAPTSVDSTASVGTSTAGQPRVPASAASHL